MLNICRPLVLAFLVAAQAHADPDEATDIINRILVSRDKREISGLSGKLKEQRYQEVGVFLADQLAKELQETRPNSYVIGSTLEALRSVGNRETLEYLDGLKQDFKALINQKFDGQTAMVILSNYEQCRQQMSAAKHSLPSTEDNLGQNVRRASEVRELLIRIHQGNLSLQDQMEVIQKFSERPPYFKEAVMSQANGFLHGLIYDQLPFELAKVMLQSLGKTGNHEVLNFWKQSPSIKDSFTGEATAGGIDSLKFLGQTRFPENVQEFHALLDQAVAQMQNRPEALPSLDEFLSKQKNRLSAESFEEWLKRSSQKSKAAAIINTVKTSIFNPTAKDLPIIGRAKETEQVFKALARMKGKSPLLLGPAGVGKTSVVIKLSQMIEQDEVPKGDVFDELRRATILETTPGMISTLAPSDIPSAQGAAMETFVEAVLAVQKEFGEKIIIFIDEVHSLNRAQAEALKRFLDSREYDIHLIGAGTFAEFNIKFKDNPAFIRRFKQIPVEELAQKEILQVLNNSWVPQIEERYSVKFDPESVDAVVTKAMHLRSRNGVINDAINLLQDAAIELASNGEAQVSEEMLYEFLQKLFPYPANPRDGKGYQAALDEWGKKIRQTVLGQEKLVDEVLEVLSQLFRNEQKRISPILILGPTGVGKTLLANTLANVVFDNPQALLEIDATAYQSGHYSLNTLMGAPRGVISSEQTSGILPEWLSDPARGKHGGVLVINEADRADKDFWDRLMEFFDRGVLVGGDGIEYPARNILVLMTSNEGTEVLYPKGIMSWSVDEVTKHLDSFSQKDLRQLFRGLDAAIMGRIDKVVASNPIGKVSAQKIAVASVANWVARNQQMYDLDIEVADNFADIIVKEKFDITEGARPLVRRLEANLDSILNKALSEWVLSRKAKLQIDLRHEEGKFYAVASQDGGASLEVETNFAPLLHPLDDPQLVEKIAKIDEMNKLIIGQDEMVASIKNAVVSHYSNKNRQRPISFALIGTTGSGKTETGKALAKVWFGSEGRFALLPLGGIQYSGELNNIFGSPRGHIGSNEVPPFEEALRDNARGGVIIFDEFSNMGETGPGGKAIKETLLKSFYTIMDEGVWTSMATGKTYDLSPYVFIFTGNDGEKLFRGVPLRAKKSVWKNSKDGAKLRSLLLAASVPEAFLGRLSGVVLAKPLEDSDIKLITDKFLDPLVEDLKERGVTLVIGNAFKNNLINSLSLSNLGGRGLRGFVDNVLVGQVNRMIFEHGNKVAKITLALKDNVDYNKRPYVELGKGKKHNVTLILKAFGKDGRLRQKKAEDITSHAAAKIVVEKKDAWSTAIHEAGHALVFQALHGEEHPLKVNYITILPESFGANHAAGHVHYRVDAPSMGEMGREEVVRQAATGLAGRLAEIYGGNNLNLGWGNDMDQIRKRIVLFVKGHAPNSINFADIQVKEGDIPKLNDQETKEADKIFDDAKKMANDVLSKHEEKLFGLADLLMEKGFVTGEQFRQFVGPLKLQDNTTGELVERMMAIMWADDDKLSARFIRTELASLERVQLENPAALELIAKLFKLEHTQTLAAAKSWLEKKEGRPFEQLRGKLPGGDCARLLD